MAELQYRSVLVIGSQKSGKTSLLSNAINSHFSDDYQPTKHVERFFDVSRQIEFIDCPGIANEIIFGADYAKPREGQRLNAKKLQSKYLAFQDDPLVREILNYPKDFERKENNILVGVDIQRIDAYLIVYNDYYSMAVAKALRHSILTPDESREDIKQNNDKKVYVLKNIPMDVKAGLIPPEFPFEIKAEQNEPLKHIVVRDMFSTKSIASDSYARVANNRFKALPDVCAATGWNQHNVLDELMGDLYADGPMDRSIKPKPRAARGVCSGPGTACTIS